MRSFKNFTVSTNYKLNDIQLNGFITLVIHTIDGKKLYLMHVATNSIHVIIYDD